MFDSCPGGETKANGNCTLPAPDDELAVQCVGPWSSEKHDIVRRYLTASGGPRSLYLPPAPGGAAFVDLFAGPGRARIRTTGELENGSPLLAQNQAVAFTRLVLCDIDAENTAALRARVPSAYVVEGDCNELIADVVAEIPELGLNVALIDPYRLQELRFETISALARFKRMDLILFFPIGEIRRNLEQNPDTYKELLNRALGTEEWQPMVKRPSDALRLVDVFKSQLQKHFGYTTVQARTVPMKNEKNVSLYHLIFASKHPTGDAIWDSITSRTPGGQLNLF